MVSSLVEAESVLAIDIGAVNTRALLFDVSDGRFRFMAAGQAPSTTGLPFKDIGVGVGQALTRLREITGRVLADKDGQVILPSQSDGSGVDALVLTTSAGPAINVVLAGVLPEVSIESAKRLAATTYARVCESLSLGDHRKMEAQMDAVIAAHPDLVLIAGGADGGASNPLTRMTEVLALACYLIPSAQRPQVLYTGNADLAEDIKGQFQGITAFRSAPNVRPAIELEDLDPAADVLAELVHRIRIQQLGGLSVYNNLANGHAMSTARAFGRMIRFLSQVYDPAKGVLGVDLGGSTTTLAAALGGRLSLHVRQPLGVGQGLAGLLAGSSLEEIIRWLPSDLPAEAVRDFIHHKQLFPNSLPVTADDLAIEQALARQAIRLALSDLGPFPDGSPIALQGSLSVPFEPIIASGAVITQAPTPGQSLMMLVDALQPIGITTLVLDQNNLLPALGASARISSLLPVQVLESGAFLPLATLIAPVSQARRGSPILNARLVDDAGKEEKVEVVQGAFHAFPVPRGQVAQLYLDPIGDTVIGMQRPGRGIKVTGGLLGVVIDARGRPVALPVDASQRRDLLKKWLWTVGG